METIKTADRAAYGFLVAGQSPVAAGLAYSLQVARPLCLLRTALLPLQLQLPLVALCECFVFTFLPISAHLHSAVAVRQMVLKRAAEELCCVQYTRRHIKSVKSQQNINVFLLLKIFHLTDWFDCASAATDENANIICLPTKQRVH